MVSKRFLFLPLVAIMALSAIGYQEAYGTITYNSTIGTGNPDPNYQFNVLDGVAVDSSGNIYVTDEDNHRIQIFDSTKTFQATIGVTGVSSPPDDLHLKFPDGVAVDSSGNIYVADTDNQRIQIFDNARTHQLTIGTGVAGAGANQFSFPSGIAVNSVLQKIYVADTNNHRIQVFSFAGAYISTIGTGRFGPSNNQFNSPSGIAVDSSGNIYVADTGNRRIQIFDSSQAYKATIGTGNPDPNYQFNSPSGVAVDSSGNIYVADTGNQRVQVFDPNRIYLSTIGVTGSSGSDNSHFNSPSGVAVDSLGKIYVADSFNVRVQIFSGSPSPITPGIQTHSGDDPPPSRLKPSFGGVGGMVFADGLTLDGKVYSLNDYAVNIPKTIADVGQPITIKIKEQLAHGPQDWKYVVVYMNFEGKDPETYNAHLILSNDKNNGQKLEDDKGYVKDFVATTELDSQYVYTTFSFTAAKAMPDSTMIVSAWDGHNRVNNVHVGGAIQFGQDPIVKHLAIPSWLHIYTNVRDADFAVENAGYVKPELFSHISNTQQIWNEPDTGHVLWFFDTTLGQVAILSYDTSGNMVWHKEEILEKAPVITTTFYSGQHLDRNKDIEMKSAKSSEELKSVQTLERLNFHN